MDTVVLDGRRLRRKEAAHAYLKKKLSFPDYYGGNLDALYDCLTDVSAQTEIVVKYTRALRRSPDGYGESLAMTLLDASRDNPNLYIVFLDSWH